MTVVVPLADLDKMLLISALEKIGVIAMKPIFWILVPLGEGGVYACTGMVC